MLQDWLKTSHNRKTSSRRQKTANKNRKREIEAGCHIHIFITVLHVSSTHAFVLLSVKCCLVISWMQYTEPMYLIAWIVIDRVKKYKKDVVSGSTCTIISVAVHASLYTALMGGTATTSNAVYNDCHEPLHSSLLPRSADRGTSQNFFESSLLSLTPSSSVCTTGYHRHHHRRHHRHHHRRHHYRVSSWLGVHFLHHVSDHACHVKLRWVKVGQSKSQHTCVASVTHAVSGVQKHASAMHAASGVQKRSRTSTQSCMLCQMCKSGACCVRCAKTISRMCVLCYFWSPYLPVILNVEHAMCQHWAWLTHSAVRA